MLQRLTCSLNIFMPICSSSSSSSPSSCMLMRWGTLVKISTVERFSGLTSTSTSCDIKWLFTSLSSSPSPPPPPPPSSSSPLTSILLHFSKKSLVSTSTCERRVDWIPGKPLHQNNEPLTLFSSILSCSERSTFGTAVAGSGLEEVSTW